MHLLTYPRRSHKKSRHGCKPCKRSHVKCDEGQPSCSLCVKRGLECIYICPEPPRKALPDTTEDDKTPRQDTSCTPGLSRVPRLQEMRLLHHFSVITAPSLACDDVDLRFWQFELPQIATAHDYVMEGLLAAAALHLAFLEADQLSYWAQIALSYQTRASAGLRNDLVSSSENHVAKFAGTALILLLITAYPGVCKDGDPIDPLNEVVTIRSALKGCALVFSKIFENQQKTSIDFWLRREGSTVSKEPQESDADLVHLHQDIMERLSEVQHAIDNCHNQYRDVYYNAYDLTLKALRTWPAEVGSITWPIWISDSFLALLEQGDWVSRIIFLFYGLNIFLGSRRWFRMGAGRRLILGVLAPIGTDIPPQWEEMVHWMKQVVNI
ncbi:hypothetical protein BDV40DRAFT_253883 [Aspergillus tamarii]|uniref:Zn(2)-C6 fungal-type domain-containing protein n=1 Tax=Aspergillus tamarii TaxID=41984 RepID=A0A5N6V7R2_ASPTM|nr:hypothetical protein BDV40DRAFT_253883 [Aspergillus tamarii]